MLSKCCLFEMFTETLRLETLHMLASYPWSRKGKYGFLLEYIRIVGSDEALAHVSHGGTESLLTQVVGQIKHQQLANYVCKTF